LRPAGAFAADRHARLRARTDVGGNLLGSLFAACGKTGPVVDVDQTYAIGVDYDVASNTSKPNLAAVISAALRTRSTEKGCPGTFSGFW